MIAKIVWKDLYIKGDYLEYKYGAEFTYISEEDSERLDRLLRQSLEKFLETDTVSSNAPHSHPNSP